MKEFGRICLLADVGRLPRDQHWGVDLDEFRTWAWSTFDRILLLTAHRGKSYENLSDSPGLREYDPIPGLLRQGFRIFWAEDDVLQTERNDLVHYVECRGASTLAEVRDRILRAM